MKCNLAFGLVLLSTILVIVSGAKKNLGPEIDVNVHDEVEQFYLNKCQFLIKDEVDRENNRGHTITLDKVTKQRDDHGTVYHCHFTAYGAKSKSCEAFIYFDINNREPTMNKAPCLIF